MTPDVPVPDDAAMDRAFLQWNNERWWADLRPADEEVLDPAITQTPAPKWMPSEDDDE